MQTSRTMRWVIVVSALLAGCQSPDVPEPVPEPVSAADPVPVPDTVTDPDPVSDPIPAPATYTETSTPNVTFTMVWVPSGNFWIGQTEVTWDEYLPFCDWEEEDRLLEGVDAITRPSKPLETYPYDHEWGTGRRPAVGMSWNAAKEYCEWLSLKTGKQYRLPTEAEWVLACGTPGEPLDDHAWYDENSQDMTQEVGLKQANEHGLHDMLGNLWEYCAEPYDVAEPDWAVLHGGSWADPASDASPGTRLKFDEFWNLMDSNVPPGVWWTPDGDHLGFRVLRPGPLASPNEGPTP